MSTAKTLKDLRDEKTWTQVELATCAQLTEATIVRLERGQHMPRAKTCRLLAFALDCRPAVIMEAARASLASGARLSPRRPAKAKA